MVELFYNGGPLCMSLLTVELICLFFAAWKAPAWVKEIGIIALVTGVLWQMIGIHHAASVVQIAGDVSPTLIAGGIKVSLVSVMYGLIIYLISLVIRITQKPRI